MVFPLFAAFYYWSPAFSRRQLSEVLGKWSFWLIFIGFNTAFLPMHVTGLIGMPRRVYTYPEELGWGTLNLISTIGAFLVAAGALVFLIDVARNLRLTAADGVGNVWNAGTLEWLPNHTFGARSVPFVASRDPLWDQKNLARDVDRGGYYLPGTATGARETIVTSAVDAVPQYVMQISGPGCAHFAAAVFTAAFFLLLTAKLVTIAVTCGLLAIISIFVWMRTADPESVGNADIGGGISLPTYVSGPMSHSWWAMVVLMLVAAALYLSYVFSYLYLWTVAPAKWPKTGAIPDPPYIAIACMAVAAGTLWAADRSLRSNRIGRVIALIVCGALALVASLGTDIWSQWQAGVRPDASGYAAIVYAHAVLQTKIVGAVLCMSIYAVFRAGTGRIDKFRRVVFDNLSLFWLYALGQGTLGLLLIHGFPRLAASL